MRETPKKTDLQKRFESFDKALLAWQVIAMLFCGLFILYLFLIQIVDINHDRIKAKRQRSAKGYIMRGTIIDRNGIKLASDKTTFNVWAHPEYYDHTPAELAQMLSPLLGIPTSTLQREFSKNQRIISLKKDIDRKLAQEIQKLGLREVSLDKKTERIYPQGTLAAHVLGYYNTDADLAGGVEHTAKKDLEDIGKEVNFEKTPDGDIIYSLATNPEQTTNPLHGKTVQLTIDTAIQHVCEDELTKMIASKRAPRGAIIVMNPKNGEILGYSVYPTYNPNDYKKATATQIKNWSLTDVYPPGSTFKVLTMSSAMELGKINEKTRIYDSGKMKIGGWEIKNYDYNKFPCPGSIDLIHLLEHSSNIGSIKMALMMTSQEFYNMLKKFGIGSKTGIDLPGESRGLLPSYKNWGTSEHASMGYGYGASVTAIQMITAVSALANNGVKVTPHVIKYTPEEAEKRLKYEQVLLPETAQSMTKLLAAAISRSKSPANLDNYTVAAKTGTSLKPKENGAGYTNKMYTSIIGYLPASNPQLLIYVVVDSPVGEAIWGSTVAAPIFREVALQSARIMNIPPDKIKKE